MRCVIFCDNYRAPYEQSELASRFEMLAYLKIKEIDFTFGLGSGQLLALNLAGAYSDEVTAKLLEQRERLIFSNLFEGVLGRVKNLDAEALDTLIKDLGEGAYLKRVEQFSAKDFLVSGNQKDFLALEEFCEVSLLRKGGLHTILAKNLISPFAEVLRNFEIHPLNIGVFNTRNGGLIKQAKVAQELVDNLTLPQYFYPTFKRAYLLGVREFFFVGDELGFISELKTEFPEAKISRIESLNDLKENLI